MTNDTARGPLTPTELQDLARLVRAGNHHAKRALTHYRQALGSPARSRTRRDHHRSARRHAQRAAQPR